MKICITARRANLFEDLAREIVAAGGLQPHIVTMDIMEEDAPQRLAQVALKGLGQIDILMNVAGGSASLKIDAPESRWNELVTLNFTRVRQLTLAVVPEMIKYQWGRIINISGKSEPEQLSSSTASKAAVHGFAKGLSREVGKFGITVNGIAPGRIMSEQIRRKYSEEFRARQSAHDIPVGRYGEPEELACLAVFLASPIARYITGAVMPVDGGLRRYAF